MRKFQGVKCPKCGKKGLNYANHPHAQGWKDYDRVACRYCGGRFKLSAPNNASSRTAGTLPRPTPDNQTTIERQQEVNSRRR